MNFDKNLWIRSGAYFLLGFTAAFNWELIVVIIAGIMIENTHSFKY